MSTVSSVSTDTGTAAYAQQLARTAQLQRSLYSLRTAIQSGNLSAAGSTLSAIMQANPQYASSSSSSSGSSSSSSSSDPVNQDFASLSTAIGSNDTAGAQAAWQQLQTDLGNEGITVSSPATSTADLLANEQETLDQSILSQTFGADASGSTLESLIGAGSQSSTGDVLSSILSNWVTYQATGSASSTVPSASGAHLNTTA
jgi:hypothetical protein